MSTSYQNYEKLAKELAENWLSKYKADLLCWGGKCKIQGISGYKHQIDLACKDTESQKLFLFECKCYQRKIGIEEVLIFHSRIRDIYKAGKNKIEGVMITTVGFTKWAKLYADYYEIKLGNVKNRSEFGVFIGGLGFVGLVDNIHAEEKVLVEKNKQEE